MKNDVLQRYSYVLSSLTLLSSKPVETRTIHHGFIRSFTFYLFQFTLTLSVIVNF